MRALLVAVVVFASPSFGDDHLPSKKDFIVQELSKHWSEDDLEGRYCRVESDAVLSFHFDAAFSREAVITTPIYFDGVYQGQVWRFHTFDASFEKESMSRQYYDFCLSKELNSDWLPEQCAADISLQLARWMHEQCTTQYLYFLDEVGPPSSSNKTVGFKAHHYPTSGAASSNLDGRLEALNLEALLSSALERSFLAADEFLKRDSTHPGSRKERARSPDDDDDDSGCSSNNIGDVDDDGDAGGDGKQSCGRSKGSGGGIESSSGTGVVAVEHRLEASEFALEGLSGLATRVALNVMAAQVNAAWAVHENEAHENRRRRGLRYLEVGSYKGSTLACAVCGNLITRAVGVDDFSEFDSSEVLLRENLAHCEGRAQWVEEDDEEEEGEEKEGEVGVVRGSTRAVSQVANKEESSSSAKHGVELVLKRFPGALLELLPSPPPPSSSFPHQKEQQLAEETETSISAQRSNQEEKAGEEEEREEELRRFEMYLYDGDHSEQSHFEAVALVLPRYCKRVCVLIVDDWALSGDWARVREGTKRGLEHINATVVFEATAAGNDWHQGYWAAVVRQN